LTAGSLIGAPLRITRLAVRAGGVTLRDPRRAWLMTRMTVMYFAVTALAGFLPMTRAFELVSPSRLGPRRSRREAASVVNAMDTVLTAGIPFMRPRCWRRAAVLHRYLALEGVDTQIVFGAITERSQLKEAHAWLEREGLPYAEKAPVSQYRRVHTFSRKIAA
jgi:hypothetical protein